MSCRCSECGQRLKKNAHYGRSAVVGDRVWRGSDTVQFGRPEYVVVWVAPAKDQGHRGRGKTRVMLFDERWKNYVIGTLENLVIWKEEKV